MTLGSDLFKTQHQLYQNESTALINIFATFVDHGNILLLGGAFDRQIHCQDWVFECNFGPRGQEFEQVNLQKNSNARGIGIARVGGGGGGIDRLIILIP